MSTPQEVDRVRVEALAVAILQMVRHEMMKPPPSRDNVLIPLNALAFAVAAILEGTGDYPAARKFFDTALEQNIEQ